MKEILKKGDRLEKPRTVSVPLRRDVYDWLSSIAAIELCPVSRIIRALVEDAFDYGVHPVPSEVTGYADE